MKVKTFTLMPRISISNQCSYFELCINQRILEKKKKRFHGFHKDFN